jgi:cyclic beta-1,2-glucan synthetase
MSAADLVPGTGLVESAARDLSSRHVVLDRRPNPIPVWSELTSMRKWLGEALAAARLSDPNGAMAAEWLLDNDYHVQRTILQIGEDLPERFYRRLPALDGEGEEGLPRVFALAHSLLHASHLQLSLTGCIQFIRAYQELAPLTVAELWAFPTMLRLACLEVLTTAFARLFPDVKVPFAICACCTASASIDETECVSRSLANLAVISSIQWKDFFDRTSRVEEILQRDPGGIYPQMDFETRDSYRHVVEELALNTGKAEWLVAARLLAQCRAETADQSQDHVGYWLVGDGRAAFERAIGSQALALVGLGRTLLRHAGALYATALLIAGAAALVVPVLYLYAVEAATPSWLIGAALTALPASILSVTLVNWIVTLLVPPGTLPKLDFKDAIPPDFPTAVVVPVLVAVPSETAALVQRLEGHRLSNPDPTLQFVLLSDHADGSAATMAGDDAVEGALVEGIEMLNARYGDISGNGPFHLLHRPRCFNPAEECWMGWERKRGKLEQFNAFVLHGDRSGFSLVAGNMEALRNLRFVVTADADTRLPPGSVNRLVGTLAHPLNRACFDGESGRVRSGYTVVQPRIEIAPENAGRSLFTRLYAGDAAIDIYSRAVSDVYQDLFGTGIFAGKGIYEVASFEKSLEGRIPVNSLVSHDLFEGLHGRVALASDIIIYEGFPSGYLDYARRGHRWIRGDWQLLPWLGRTVPGRDGRRLPNRLSFLDRWKILDNLRRSIVPINLVALALAGWFLLHGSPWVWTILTVVAPGAYLFTDLVTGLARGRRRGVMRSTLHRFSDHIGRWALTVIFLVNDAALALNAISRSIWRLGSGRHLLEWTSAAHMAARFAAIDQRAAAWRDMWPSPAVALLVATGLGLFNPAALASATPLLVLWFLAPEIAVRVSRSRPPPVDDTTLEDRAFLRRIARRTWLFFETFVRPEDNWLPPDNYQEIPHEEIAHRTSPTNIGMMFLSSLTAWKLGYIGLTDLTSRMRNALDSLDRLERYRGHILNWYDTRLLKSLEPRYVSTVDSGNLATSLIVVKEACREAMQEPALRPASWDGLRDCLHLLSDSFAASSIDFDDECHEMLRELEEAVLEGRDDADPWDLLLEQLCEHKYPRLEASVRRAIEKSEATPTASLREIQIWLERTRHHLTSMRRDVGALLPWRTLISQAPVGCEDSARQIAQCLPANLALQSMEAGCQEARAVLAEIVASETDAHTREWAEEVDRALVQTAEAHRDLHDHVQEIATRSADWAHGMDFGMLFDKSTRLFHIGYNVSAGRVDPNHYDLLASEARLASYFAISKGDVAPEHWFFLGRPITKKASGLSLVSWNGSMFEYLMPTLFLRSDPSTLLGQSNGTAVDIQREYGDAHDVPWGISESGFASQDPEKHYRYRAFGIPDLGLRRGLSRDLVVAPYATILALSVRAGAALRNLKELESLGLVGRYGFYEAADFTPERVLVGERFSVVRSYMAHHHGMSLAAMGNALCSDMLVEWFHADRHIRTIDLLLNERVPWELPPELTRDEMFEVRTLREGTVPALRSWEPPIFDGQTQLHVLSNGRLTSHITTMDGGGVSWHQQALTRCGGAVSQHAENPWLRVQDKDDGRLWSIGREPPGMVEATRVVFHQHQVEFHRSDHGIAVSMEVGIPPGDDLEIRRITVVNETGRPRRLALTSYAEVVLGSLRDHERHPAFSKLFVGSEYLREMKGLLFMRRPRHPDERPPVMLHRMVADDAGIDLAGFETDRRAFVGRYGQPGHLDAPHGGLSGGLGWTLDPVMALQAGLELEAYGRCELAFVTIAAGSRESALEVANRYTTLSSLDWASSDATTAAAREVHRLGLEPGRLPELQVLLSAVLRPHPALRTAPGLIAANRLSQSDLWTLGISGDHPILALRTGDAQKTELLRIVVAAYQLWRRHGTTVELVVLHTGMSGYVEPVRERLIEVLRDASAQDFLGRNGGIHLVLADQAGAGRALLVEAAAHVVLDEMAGSLSYQLSRLNVPPVEGPRFEPTGFLDQNQGAFPGLPRPDDLLFDNGFGGFGREGTEYVVHLEPDDPPPAPWSNVLANEDFGTIVTEAGLGWTWATNSGENRLTPWSNDPVGDPQTEALYLRDEETARLWTPTPQPAGNGTACRVRHGAGYTVWEKLSEGLEQELCVFVSRSDPVKIVRLRVRDLQSRPRRVTATYYAEWLLGAGAGQPNPLLVAEYDAGAHALLASNRWNAEFGDRVAFLTSTLPPHSLTTSRSEFVGRHGDTRRPEALLRWDMGGRLESATDCCGAFQVHLDIGAGEIGEVAFILGQGDNRAQACELAKRWQRAEHVDRALDVQRQAWNELLGAVQVKTPDAAFDVMVNRWLVYQTMSSRLLARAGFYQAGGAFGFRDQLQDVLALLHADPDRARRHIVTAAARQFEEGDVLHWWHPPLDRGVRTRCSDDLLWLPYVASVYVEATGDDTILSEMVPFLTAPPLAANEKDRYARFEPTSSRRSIFEHCERALDRGFNLGAHGLPLMGSGDWNDGMNRIGEHGRGESVWLAWFMIATIKGFVGLCERQDRGDLVERWSARALDLQRVIEESGWDGEWYLRAIDDDGRPWGSASNDECQIDSIAQSWAVLSEAGDRERALRAVGAAAHHLIRDDDRLVRLLWPAFDTTPRDPGYIKAYPPGIRENGGQYSHAAAWLGIAFARLGDGDRAKEVFDRISPVKHTRNRNDAERYRTEPYVLAADIAGVAPHVGRGGWSWYTGAAAWTWRLAVEHILGLQLVEGNLRISPCLPKEWKGFEARIARPAGDLVISVEDPDGLGSGRVTITVNGKCRTGDTVEFPADGTTYQVHVRICLPRTEGDRDGDDNSKAISRKAGAILTSTKGQTTH